ncbi:MAG: phosphopentomutase, partial [Paracoccaceae bacterium]|nr:phosphopentomutase [Paracoccaceae bacterium]
WTYFSDTKPSFPDHVTSALCEAAGTDGILGNEHASGTEVIERLGDEHVRTGYPICYTSADSVLQVAAHEERFGLDRLLEMCQKVAPLLHGMKLGRVIARPFVGRDGDFKRTGNRRDFAIAPPAPTLCDWVKEAGGHVHAIGKISDIFSGQGIGDVAKGRDVDLMEALKERVRGAAQGSLTFANFVEFDSEYGHRRDISGYARALEWFDAEIGQVIDELRDGDLMVITADHGNDPSWVGTDHTRERVPVLVYGAGAGSAGHVGFVDVAATVAAHLNVPIKGSGRSFL